MLDRRKLLKNSSALAAISILPASIFSASAAAKPTRQKAPELAVDYWIDGNGKEMAPFSVAANKGKWIYLKCFQEWCPACHSVGFPNLQKLMEAFPNSDKLAPAVIQTTFEGHYFNTVGALRKNQKRYELDLPFGHDPGNDDLPDDDPGHYPSTMVNFKTRGTPWVTVINPQGEIMFSDFHIDIDRFITYLKTQGV